MAKTTLPVKAGMIAVFKGYAEPELENPFFQEGDIISLESVPENYMEEVIDCFLAERDGENKLHEQNGEQLYLSEFEIISTKQEWEQKWVDDVEAEAEEKPKAKKAKKKTEPKESKKASTKKTSKKKTTSKKSESKEVAVAEDEATEPTHQELVPYETSQLMDYVNTTDLHSAAMHVSKISSDSDVVLAALMYRIHTDEIYKEYSTNFEEYCNTYYEGTIGYRKAMYLVNCYGFLQSLGKDLNAINEIGYSKMGQIVSAAKSNSEFFKGNPDVVDDLFNKAKELTKDQFSDYVKETVKITEESASDETMNWTHVTFKMPEHMLQAIKDAITHYKSTESYDEQEGYTDGQFLYQIIEEWYGEKSKPMPELEVAIENLEARYGVSLQVVENEEVHAKAS